MYGRITENNPGIYLVVVVVIIPRSQEGIPRFSLLWLYEISCEILRLLYVVVAMVDAMVEELRQPEIFGQKEQRYLVYTDCTMPLLSWHASTRKYFGQKEVQQ